MLASTLPDFLLYCYPTLSGYQESSESESWRPHPLECSWYRCSPFRYVHVHLWCIHIICTCAGIWVVFGVCANRQYSPLCKCFVTLPTFMKCENDVHTHTHVHLHTHALHTHTRTHACMHTHTHTHVHG